LILKEKDWQKIWDFAILIGILVSLIAIFQWQGLFKEILITAEQRPPSTIGGPIFLAIYLLLLSFLTLSFAIREKFVPKKIFYILSLFLFLFVIFLTYTRAAYFGLAVGFLYFLLFYPRRLILLKILILIFLILGIYGIYYINAHSQLPQFIQENNLLLGAVQRLSIKAALEDARVSGWPIGFEALKERPILGWGPENFAVGFDKYYDPILPAIAREYGSALGWWDRAHNFFLDIGVTAGIPALIIYLLLFGSLFWQLQRLKSDANLRMKYESTNDSIIAHGIQATFIGYLAANFFSFDTFSTYLISFLIIGYSLHLISFKNTESVSADQSSHQRKSASTSGISKWRWLIMFFLFIALIWFLWTKNIKPFQINTQINVAKYQVENNMCEQGLARMEKVLPKRSFLDSYLRIKYADFMKNCGPALPGKSLEFAQKGREIMKEAVEIQPYFTRSWILLGNFTNILIEKKSDEIINETDPEKIQKLKEELNNLKNEANSYFEKANKLSPKRQEVFLGWINTDLLTDEYQKAKEKAEKCIEINPRPGDCYWYLALSQITLKDFEKAKENIKIASQKGHPIDSFESLSQLAEVYTRVKNYQELEVVFKKLIQLKPNEPQYHATLAFVYKELGEFDKAREEALIVLQLLPEARGEVELFLQTLPH